MTHVLLLHHLSLPHPHPHHHHSPSPTTLTSPTLPFRTQYITTMPSHKLIHTQRIHVTCMANPRRQKMVARQIQRELSDMLITDHVLQYAIQPEASLGADQYLSSVTTITDVEVSTDLRMVKVYVSVFGDERGREVALAGLKSKAKYVRGELGRRMRLRLTPEVRFIEDESLERGSRVIAILDKIKNENSTGEFEGEKGEYSESSDIPVEDDDDDDDGNWDVEDPDEGIIYVK